METILLLEDDSANRIALSTILELDGYFVASAPTGTDAVKLCRKLDSIDLLVADIGIPDMSGTEAALGAVGCRPELGVLFISGKPVDCWDEQDQRNLKRLKGRVIDFLEKPFRSSVLRDKVRELLTSLRRISPRLQRVAV